MENFYTLSRRIHAVIRRYNRVNGRPRKKKINKYNTTRKTTEVSRTHVAVKTISITLRRPSDANVILREFRGGGARDTPYGISF